MVCRPAVKPLIVGLGAAAVLAAGGASAVAATDPPSPPASPTPSPSQTPAPSPTEAPRPGSLKVDLDPVEQTAEAGETVGLTVHVAAVDGTVESVGIAGFEATSTGPKPKIVGGCQEPFESAVCVIGTLEKDEKGTAGWKLSLPKETKEKVEIGVTVTVTATGLEKDVTSEATVTFTPPADDGDGNDDDGDNDGDNDGDDGDDDGDGGSDGGSGGSGGSDGGSGGSGGSDGSSGSGGSSGPSGSGSGSSSTSGSGGSTDLDVPDYPDPSPNSSFEAESPDVALPPLSAPSPSVAPDAVAATPQSRLRPNKAPVAQELTFERLASTQVAWLAALMVVFGLLLTQARLGRRTAMARGRVPKGLHRRTRRGMFGR